jgi:hypothetical protein
VRIAFDEESAKPHVTLIPETQGEADEIRMLIAFQEVTFFIELDSDDDLVCELINPNPGEKTT